MRIQSVIVFVLVSWVSGANAHGERAVPYVRRDVPPAVLVDGSNRATVIVPQKETPLVQKAAQLLASTVRDMTGVELPVVKEGVKVNGPVIHVGPTTRALEVTRNELSGLDADGYILCSLPGELIVIGGSENGTFFGVSTLLQKYCGVRWLFPGELGRVIPKSARLVLEKVNLRDEPVMTSRYMCMSGLDEEWMWLNRMRSRDNFHHHLNSILNSSKYGQTHPDFYPIRDGKRFIPKPDSYDWQPCTSNPAVIRTVAEEAIRHFDEHPEEESFSIGNADGGGWCECAACQKMDALPRWSVPSSIYDRSSTPRVFTFMNRVAEEVAQKYPNKKLGCLAYSTYITPPTSFRLHPMLIPYLTSTRDGYANADFKRLDQGLLDDWCKVARQMGIYEYHYGAGFLVPRIYPRLLADALRHASDHGVTGFFAEVAPNWALDGPKLYATANLTWNPALDPGDLMEDYCRSLFGPAARPMLRHFERCEKIWARSRATWGQHWGWPGVNDPRQFLPYTAEAVADSMQDMEQALQLAGSDELIKKRVKLFRKAFEVTRMGAPVAESLRRLERKEPAGRVLRTLVDTASPKPEMVKYLKENFADDPFSIYPRMFTHDFWMDSPRVPEAEVKTEILQRLMVKALADARQAPPAEFVARLKAGIEDQLRNELRGVETDARLEKARDDIVAWGSKACRVPSVTTPPAMDGDPDDPAWKAASWSGDFCAHQTAAASPTRTTFSACHDRDRLYLVFRCEQPRAETEAHAGVLGQDVSVWENNSLELFFNRDEKGSPYHQLAVNAAGGVFDMRAGDASWTLKGLTAAARIQDNQWICELSVPLQSLGLNLATDRVIRFNVARNRVTEKGQEISSWFPSLGWHRDECNRGLLLLE